MTQVSLTRIYALRIVYLLLIFGLGPSVWPGIIHHEQPWPLMEGVVNCMLGAISALAFLGLRYPLRLLPLLLFEAVWKVIWLSVVAIPAWSNHRLEGDTLTVTYECLGVVVLFVLIPWRYVFESYVKASGEPWR